MGASRCGLSGVCDSQIPPISTVFPKASPLLQLRFFVGTAHCCSRFADNTACVPSLFRQTKQNVFKVDLSKCESRVLRIARGSGTHPDEVRGLLKLHKHFEKVFGKFGKNMKGEASKVKQLQVCCVGYVLFRLDFISPGYIYLVCTCSGDNFDRFDGRGP